MDQQNNNNDKTVRVLIDADLGLYRHHKVPDDWDALSKEEQYEYLEPLVQGSECGRLVVLNMAEGKVWYWLTEREEKAHQMARGVMAVISAWR